jgi:hypothetical protein
MIRRFRCLGLPVVILFACGAATACAEVTAERSQQGVVIKIDGKPFAEYLADVNGTPAVWPIIGPTGKPMTRAYPMGEQEGEKTDHRHHRSLWFNHGSVNGLSFWDRETIKQRELVKVESGPAAVIVTRNDWLAPDGKRVCSDERTLTFGTDGDARYIDFDVVVTATDGPVTFGDTKEGSFGVRVAATMKVDAKLGGRIVNSDGLADGDAWGKRANWVDYHGPVDGQTVGIAILNHPSSFRFPTYWHVRTYGLFAANPFGVREFTRDKEADGSYTLKPGESMALHYRVLFHRGDEKAARIAEAYDAYSKLEK